MHATVYPSAACPACRRLLFQVQTVTARQVHDLLQQQPDKYVVIDVRNKDEQQVG